MNKKIRIGALISGSGTNLQAIIDGCERGTISGQMVFVGSDNPDAAGLERARQSRIPIFVVDYTSIIQSCKKSPQKLTPPPDFNLDEAISKQTFFDPNADAEKTAFFLTTRAIAEAQLLSRMKAFDVDLLVLAGFMRNLTPYFIDRVNTDRSQPRIMNIHPALLPAFPGVDGYGDTFRYGCKVGGCTVHFIDYGEDTGPKIGQRAFDIAEADTLESIREKGLKFEWQLYPECIQLYAQGRLKMEKMTYTHGSGRKSERFIVRIEPPQN
ncbi:MAG: phosphoribosylglycinamide formyltransferase [Desulfobacteraceae bacterium]|jgi:phosphoribosylglycinamide formyltransferase-1